MTIATAGNSASNTSDTIGMIMTVAEMAYIGDREAVMTSGSAFRLRKTAGWEVIGSGRMADPKIFPGLIVCEHCDCVFKRARLVPGRSAFCTRCGSCLYMGPGLTIDQWLALTLTAAVAFLIACFSPVVSLDLQGMHTEATLWQVVVALLQGPMSVAAALLILSIVVVPATQIALLVWVLMTIRYCNGSSGLIPAMRLLTVMRPWSMMEVGLLGVLVSTIKLSSATQVVIGPGLWAMVGLTFLMDGIAGRNIRWLWNIVRINGRPTSGEL
ncbi:paraquat-inducible protein A [Achromobacter aloeverae]